MRLSTWIVALGLLGGVWAAGSAAAEPLARTVSYKAPIVASLSQDDAGRSRAADRSADDLRGSRSAPRLLSSPGGQLATMAAVFVCAMFLASLASTHRE